MTSARDRVRLPRLRRRSLSLVAAIASLTTASVLYANRSMGTDVYWLLAAGRDVARSGISSHDPFATLATTAWQNQQWLPELVLYGLHLAAGPAGVSLGYALLLGAALVPLALVTRGRSPWLVLGAWALTVPALIALLDPRAGGFGLLACALLVALLVQRDHRSAWLMPVVMVFWANVHGSFLIGIGLIALALITDVLDRRGDRGRLPAILGTSLAACAVTPLGLMLLTYLRLFEANTMMPKLTFEWQPTWQHPALVVAVIAFAAFAIAIWRSQTGPRSSGPLVFGLATALVALTATRQLTWLGPVAFLLVAQYGRPSTARLPRHAIRLAVAGGCLAVIAWPLLMPVPHADAGGLVDVSRYAVSHPPTCGRILNPAGSGSYMLWRSPGTAIAFDGRLERFRPADLQAGYAVLDGSRRDLSILDRWHVGAVITAHGRAVAPLERAGFHVAYRSASGWYLVRPTC